MRALKYCLALLIGLGSASAIACDTPVSVCDHARPGSFALVAAGKPSAILTDATADPAVRHAAASFAEDLRQVSGAEPDRLTSIADAHGAVVAIGVLGKSPMLDALVASGKIDARAIAGRWEGFRQIVVEKPWPHVPRALVIIGADRRGAVFGTYDLSEAIGVSPWAWWADVPVRRRATVYLTAGARSDWPRVRYRGFFINDEDPAFSGWAKKRFGGVNAEAYRHVFELLLRLKGNYLWPAMWAPKAFALDDPRDIPLADEMGVVMGTSHHEPMTRAQAEWRRDPPGGKPGGKWDYSTNADALRDFWRGGIRRMMGKGGGAAFENLVTVGMRGDGDEPMSEGMATALLERVVADQRAIIADVTGRPASQTPQVWALYKEVQDYYDHGMRVPDDVTLLFSDDNWGQIRRLPDATADVLTRPGGYGVYYHFDYVGGPRNYKWINTTEIGKVWQQMDLAYQRGARALWIVNVGDIKPLEYPLDFFLKMAWNPEAMTGAALASFPERWARTTFGDDHAAEIGGMLSDYGRLAARRKPELLDQTSFPLGAISPDALDGGTFGTVVDDWRALARRAEALQGRLLPDQQSAFTQLLGYPVAAFANLYEMYYAAAWNKALAAKNDARANAFADQVEHAFARDAALTADYHALSGGKWDGMMNQVHMSYVIWNDPTQQTMPSIMRVGADTPPEERGARPVFRKPSEAAGPAIERPATRFDHATAADGIGWVAVPHVGPGGAALVALPQGRAASVPGKGPHVDYDLTTTFSGDARLVLTLAPTLDTTGGEAIRIGISIDDGPVRVLTAGLLPTAGEARSAAQQAWSAAVITNAHPIETVLPAMTMGAHRLRLWRIDDNAVVETIRLEPIGR